MKKIFRILLLSFPFLHTLFFKIKAWRSGQVSQYPRPLHNELSSVADVLYYAGWNMSYSNSTVHAHFEEAFAGYTGTRYAVAVNSGGTAIQMLLRALGIKPGDEVVHQVDTCVANPFSVINAFANPVFADISPESFMLSKESLASAITSNTRVIMPIHMWGYAEDLDMVSEVAGKNNLIVIEDSCLALGAEYRNRKSGSIGTAGIFSFGCIKPLQAGEGGMITTNNESLAKELKAMRAWGDRSAEFGIRDQSQLSWNGRASEIVMAVAHEQFKKYPRLLQCVRENIEWFSQRIQHLEGIRLKSANENCNPSYSQVVFEITDMERLPKNKLFSAMNARHVQYNHANFELLTSLSFFKNKTWKEWNVKGNTDYLDRNYTGEFPNARKVYQQSGFGIYRSHFESRKHTQRLISDLEACLRDA